MRENNPTRFEKNCQTAKRRRPRKKTPVYSNHILMLEIDDKRTSLFDKTLQKNKNNRMPYLGERLNISANNFNMILIGLGIVRYTISTLISKYRALT